MSAQPGVVEPEQDRYHGSMLWDMVVVKSSASKSSRCCVCVQVAGREGREELVALGAGAGDVYGLGLRIIFAD